MSATMKRVMTIALAVAFLTAGPASAISIVDVSDTDYNELHFYEIWNELYGSPGGVDYTSSQDVYNDWGVDSLGGEDLFTYIDEDGAYGFEAVYAGNNQEFGYYTPGDPSDTTELDSVSGGNALLGGSPSGPLNPGDTGDPFGFYLETGNSEATWYSESSLHGGTRQLAVFRTPGDGVTNALNGNGTRQYDLLLAWEDRKIGETNSDSDYNDLVVGVEGIEVVPEPTSMTLLGIGLAGFATRRVMSRKKKA